MGMPPGELSGDTLMPPGAVRPDLRPQAEDDFARPHPTDAPGSVTDGWAKADAYTDGEGAGGWHRIDDVGDDGTARWGQT